MIDSVVERKLSDVICDNTEHITTVPTLAFETLSQPKNCAEDSNELDFLVLTCNKQYYFLKAIFIVNVSYLNVRFLRY